ncbi:hypothetical protein PISMIDRAFT_19264 [Pisolithus microcarpus 441]|uniref:Uncharacterized protein n=1 Tax=Pisolithus microcarpus 441 TaxID=765257 RepID=A0A0C9XHD4_9AGAM|nr:hypothetical protein PISMIDRAFT_19264 [Pisolithus microcarpus 441]
MALNSFATKTLRVVTVSHSTQATTTLFLNFCDYVVLNRPDAPFLVRLHPIAVQDGLHTRFAILTAFGRIMEGPPDRTLEPALHGPQPPKDLDESRTIEWQCQWESVMTETGRGRDFCYSRPLNAVETTGIHAVDVPRDCDPGPSKIVNHPLGVMLQTSSILPLS